MFVITARVAFSQSSYGASEADGVVTVCVELLDAPIFSLFVTIIATDGKDILPIDLQYSNCMILVGVFMGGWYN